MRNLCKYLFLLLVLTVRGFAGDGTWRPLKTANEVVGRSECAFAACDSLLYLIGGDGASNVEALAPASLTWSRKAAMPVPMNHLQAVPLNGKIYVLDAFEGGQFPDQSPITNVYIYDTHLNSWHKGVEIPADRRRGAAGAAAYHDKIYVVAGITHGHSSGTNSMFDVYDPQTDTWTALKDAPHTRDHCTAAVIHDKLYVVGGRNTSYHEPDNFMAFMSKTVLDVDCYDFTTGTWSTLDAKLPLGSGGGTLVNFHDKLYYMGGERATATEQNAPRKNTFYLDPSGTEGWKTADSLKQARNGTSATVFQGKIYLAGGSGGGPGGPPPNGRPGNPPPAGSMPRDTTRGNPPGGPNGGGRPLAVEVFSN
jgi:N-acetylneuraminic acid mutarotase